MVWWGKTRGSVREAAAADDAMAAVVAANSRLMAAPGKIAGLERERVGRKFEWTDLGETGGVRQKSSWLIVSA